MCDYHYPHYLDEETEAGGLSKKPKGTRPGSDRARTQIKRWAPAATLHHPETLLGFSTCPGSGFLENKTLTQSLIC